MVLPIASCPVILVENVNVAETLFLATIRSTAAMLKFDINTGSFKSASTWTKRETLGVPHPVIASQPEHQKKWSERERANTNASGQVPTEAL